MKTSPLTLKRYVVARMAITANREFKLDQPVNMSMDDFTVTNELVPSTYKDAAWQIILQIQLRANPQRNFTYSFDLDLVGYFDVAPEYPEDKRDQLLHVNGSSMLYGAAREIIRNLSAQGPFQPLLLPSVSFYPKKDSPPAAEPEKKE